MDLSFAGLISWAAALQMFVSSIHHTTHAETAKQPIGQQYNTEM